MWEPTPQNIENLRTNNLFKMFSLTKKNEVMKYAAGITITGRELKNIILGCKHLGYLYFQQQAVIAPEHLSPKDEEISSLSNKFEHPHKLKLQQKFVSKIKQSFKDRKLLIFHLFTASTKEWHLIYFNEKDSDVLTNNHWGKGPHIHFVNYLWGNIDLENLWNNFPKFPSNGLHIKYEDN